MRDLRIGIDVGGTNTDAVLVDDAGGVVSKTKVPTTQDPSEAITSALTAVLPAETERVARVVLGTTHAVNAILERRGLRRVAVVRIGAPATRSVRPLFGWPEDLRSAVSAGEAVVRGGVEIDGRDVVPLDADEVAAFLRGVGAGAEAVAITGVFSPLDPRQELAVAQLAAEALGPVPVSLGHRIGSLGLLERENATVLNAALGSVIGQVVSGLQVAMADHRLACPAFLAQNDGTPMAVGLARGLPVLTIGSGPANSVRGAAALSRLDEAIVVDVGGTSTDVGVLARGFPRESTAGVEMGGVRTNFRMPDLVSIALGGGSIVGSDGSPGPRSVGAALTTDALVFGGETPTLTDAAVAAGRADLGVAARVGTSRARLLEALRRAEETVADAIDRAKTARGDSPVVLVGGGSVLLPDEVPGASCVHRPEHFEVANAIGAAIARAAGESDRIVVIEPGGRDAALEACTEDARDRAVEAGADPSSLETVWLEEVPLAYLDVPAVRVRVKVAGPLRAD